MKTYTIYLALMMAVVAGCSSTNVSKREPFSSYLGRPLELQYPMALVARHGIWSGGNDGVFSLRSADFGLKAITCTERNWFGYVYKKDQVLAELSVGQTVRIDRVVDEYFIDGEYIVAYGHTTLPHTTNEVTFAYHWGFLWTLQAAPWEPETVPSRRDVHYLFRN